MIYVFLALLAFDAFTTAPAIKAHKAIEGNPRLRALMDHWGVNTAVYGTHAVFGIVVWWRHMEQPILIGLLVTFGAVAVNNIRVLRKA
jgi:hypothetical protein